MLCASMALANIRYMSYLKTFYQYLILQGKGFNNNNGIKVFKNRGSLIDNFFFSIRPYYTVVRYSKIQEYNTLLASNHLQSISAFIAIVEGISHHGSRTKR